MEKTSRKTILWKAAVILFLTLVMTGGFQFSTYAQTVVDEWSAVKAPPPPELKQISVDPRTTALLLLDFNKQTCNSERRPRCIASIPQVKRLLVEARAKGSTVIYSLSPGAIPADIATELAPAQNDPIVTSGPDKFLGTDLLKILSEKKITTVIVTGTAAHGAVLYTASGAALRGIKVVLPVDGLSAESLYPEQYTVWHLLNAPRVSGQTSVTKIDLIRFMVPK
jgi:nicotinamidase-related amidase